MEEQEDDYTVDPLFLAVTRPAMMFNIPLEAAMFVIMAFAVTLIAFKNPIYGAVAGLLCYGVARLISRHDVNAFRLMMLLGRTKAANRNRKLWGGSSYTPIPLDALRRKGFGRYVD